MAGFAIYLSYLPIDFPNTDFFFYISIQFPLNLLLQFLSLILIMHGSTFTINLISDKTNLWKLINSIEKNILFINLYNVDNALVRLKNNTRNLNNPYLDKKLSYTQFQSPGWIGIDNPIIMAS